MTIREAVIQKIKEAQHITVPVTEESNLYTDLGYDSLSFIALLTQLEAMFSITINIDEMQACVQAGYLIELVELRAGRRGTDD